MSTSTVLGLFLAVLVVLAAGALLMQRLGDADPEKSKWIWRVVLGGVGLITAAGSLLLLRRNPEPSVTPKPVVLPDRVKLVEDLTERIEKEAEADIDHMLNEASDEEVASTFADLFDPNPEE